MGVFHTTTQITDGQASGTQFATVKAESRQQAAQKVEALLQEKGWQTGHTDVQPGRWPSAV
ncbi:hypothetical protein [Streptomyces sp. NPDC001948]